MSEQTGKTTIELKYPVRIDGTEVSVLHMRRPKVRDQLLIEKSGMAGKSAPEKELLLFANLLEVAPHDLDELDLADYKAIQNVYFGFLEG